MPLACRRLMQLLLNACNRRVYLRRSHRHLPATTTRLPRLRENWRRLSNTIRSGPTFARHPFYLQMPRLIDFSPTIAARHSKRRSICVYIIFFRYDNNIYNYNILLNITPVCRMSSGDTYHLTSDDKLVAYAN